MIVPVIKSLLLVNLLAVCMLHNMAFGSEDQRLFKAAFIYNFAKFTRWPNTSDITSETELFLCTQGQDQLVTDLKRLRGKVIKGRPLSVKEFTKSEHCDMLYIASSHKSNYTDTLNTIRGKPILTISEIKLFAQSGGIIELNHDKGQTRITANLNAAHENKLELSSRLLMLSDIVSSNKTK